MATRVVWNRSRKLTSDSEKFDITPDPTLLEDIGAASFTVPEAIVELVANSIDARVDDDKLHIDVRTSDTQVTVLDDGHGMTKVVLRQAVRLSVKYAAPVVPGRARKGMYGLGMKTACASIGRYWSVVTRPVDEQQEYRVDFDLAEWTANAGNPDFKWEISIKTSRPDVTGPLGKRPHGTAIIVEKLRHAKPPSGAVAAQLSVAYKPHLELGDEIRVNDEPVVAPAFDFIEGSRQEFDEDLGANKHIRGWVALDKQTHNEGNFGFNLYREDQCVETWNKEWFPAHLMTSRIVGEAHLDFVPANFHKKGFAKGSSEWRLATAAMKEFLRPVVKASRTMSIGKHDATRFARALEGLNRALGTADQASDIAADGSTAIAESVPASDSPAPGITVTASSLQLPDGPVRLIVNIEAFGTEETPWDYVYDDGARELQAVLNSGSRLYRKVNDQSFLGMLALADCVASFLVSERGQTAASAREIRNRWLYLALPD